MGALTPEERRRLAQTRRAEDFRVDAPQRPRPAVAARRAARGLRTALLLTLGLATALAGAWLCWSLLHELSFPLPPSLLDWLLPPMPSQTFP